MLTDCIRNTIILLRNNYFLISHDVFSIIRTLLKYSVMI